MPHAIIGQGLGPGLKWQYDVWRLLQYLKAGGKNANDGVRLVIERERLAENIFCAREAALPESVTDHCHACCAWAIFLRQEDASASRLHAQQIEDACIQHLSGEALGLARAGERGTQITDRAHGR